MIEQMTLKLQAYDRNAAEAWFADLPGNPETLDKQVLPPLLEWDNDGCWVMSENDCVYHNFTNGSTYKLSKKTSYDDWALYCQLFIKTSRNKEVRLCSPIERTVVEVNGVEWDYNRYIRPGFGNGEVGVYADHTAIMQTNLEALINDYYYLLKNMIEISNEYADGLVPSVNLGARMKDDDGYFFYRNWSEWTFTPHDNIERVIGTYKKYGPMLNVSEEWFRDWLDRASAKWRTLYE